MDNLLNPDIGLIIWTVITFLLLVGVLSKFAWKPMLKTLQDREDSIRRALSDAEAARSAAEALKVQNEKELARVREKSDELIRAARVDAERLRADLIRKAEEEGRRLREQTKAQIEQDRARLGRELRQEVAGLSVRVAEKLLRHAVNVQEQERLATEFVKELEKETTKP